jgi:hypothetical protein
MDSFLNQYLSLLQPFLNPLFKLIEHFKNQGRCDTYNVNLKKETERYIVNHKNELKENLITDIPFSVSEIKKCINKLKMKKVLVQTIYVM